MKEQLALFSAPQAATRPSEKPQVESFTFIDCAYQFAQKRRHAPVKTISCSICGCTEEHPCRLRTGDDCVLDERGRVCSNPNCLAKSGVRALAS